MSWPVIFLHPNTLRAETTWPTLLADDIFKCIFVNERNWLSNKIKLKYVSLDTYHNSLALVEVMVWSLPQPLMTNVTDISASLGLNDLTHLPLDKMGAILADDIFKRIFLNENVIIAIQISLKFVTYGPIGNKSALVRVMAWRRTGDKPLPEPMMTQSTDAKAALGGDELKTRAKWTTLLTRLWCNAIRTTKLRHTKLNTKWYYFGRDPEVGNPLVSFLMVTHSLTPGSMWCH